MSHCLPSPPPKPAAPTFQIAASSQQTQLITGPSLAVGTPCFSRTAVIFRLCPSTPPLPRLAFTFSQAISRFFRLYTLSTNEWTFLAPVGLIQSASLLGRGCKGISLMELFLLLALTHLAFSLFPTIFVDCLPRPTSVADCSVTRFSSCLWYYTVVRLLTERRSPLRFRL